MKVLKRIFIILIGIAGIGAGICAVRARQRTQPW